MQSSTSARAGAPKTQSNRRRAQAAARKKSRRVAAATTKGLRARRGVGGAAAAEATTKPAAAGGGGGRGRSKPKTQRNKRRAQAAVRKKARAVVAARGLSTGGPRRRRRQAPPTAAAAATGGTTTRRENNDNSPPVVNGGVPLFTLFNTTKVQNLRGELRTVPKYTQFDSEGRWVTDPRFPQELSMNEKMRLVLPPPEPPLCPGEKLDLRDQNSCFVRGMRDRLAPALAQLKNASRDACATKTAELQPHQRAVFNLARTMATRTPEELNGYRGLLCWHNTGSGKSLCELTPLVQFSGRLVRAGDLRVGMELLGMDGTPRRVLDVGTGVEEMFEIRPTKGDPWRCNASHILSLRYNRQGAVTKTRHDTYTVFWHQYVGEAPEKAPRGEFRCRNFDTKDEAAAYAATLPGRDEYVVDIPLQDYLSLPIYMRHYLKLFRARRVSFEARATPPLIDPYALGAWLGDGYSNGPQLCLGDAEIAEEIARRTGLTVSVQAHSAGKTARVYRIKAPSSAAVGVGNPFMTALRHYDLLHNKHIPEDVKCGSVDDRLAVLAGLLDTDGHYQGGCYEITQKSARLAEDIAFVARSLGFAAYLKTVEKTCVKPGGERVPGVYHRLHISGAGLEDLPLAVARKRAAAPRLQVKDALCTGFDVVPVGLGKYVGPVLDGDHRYCLWDFTVTHNTVTSLGIVLAFWDTKRNIVLATTPANEADNNLSKYALNLFCFYPEYVSKVFKSPSEPYPPPPWTLGSEPLKRWCNNKDNIKPLLARVKTYTFTTLASDLCLPKTGSVGRSNPTGPRLLQGGTARCGQSGGGGGGNNNGGGKTGSVLIMDEVQSLFTPDKQYADAATFLVQQLTKDAYRDKMYVFALTATPGNKVSDMINVLNFVRPAKAPAFTEKDAASNPEKFAGLVSYVDIRSDATRYGQKQVKNVYVEMSPRYYAGFLKTVSVTEKDKNYAALQKQSKEASFMVKQRAAGNFLTKTSLGGLYTDDDFRKFASSRPVPRAVALGAQVRVLSDKLMSVLENATTMPGKQYIWVAELNTAKVVVAALTKMGFAQVGPKDYSKGRDARGKPVLTPSDRLKAPGKRFILYKKGTANGEQLDEGILTAFAQTFSNRDNDTGDKVKIMLATETYYQGLDMRALQGVHLADSLFNATADKQAVGRALRLCGHSGAPSKKVTVYRYFSTPPAKFDAENVAAGAKGAARAKLAALGAANKAVRAIPPSDVFKGARLPEGHNTSGRMPPGVNTFVYADAARRQKPVDDFELALKAYAVDCPLFKAAYHAREPFQCGVRPSAAASVAAAAGGGVNNKKKKSKKAKKTTAANSNVARPPPAGSGREGLFSKLFGGGGSSPAARPSTPAARPSPPAAARPSAPPLPPNLAAAMMMTGRVGAGVGGGVKQARPGGAMKRPAAAAAATTRVNALGRPVVTNASLFFKTAAAPAAAAKRKTARKLPGRPSAAAAQKKAASARKLPGRPSAAAAQKKAASARKLPGRPSAAVAGRPSAAAAKKKSSRAQNALKNAQEAARRIQAQRLKNEAARRR